MGTVDQTQFPALCAALRRNPPAPGAAALAVHLSSTAASPTQTAYVMTLGEAVAVCRQYIALHALFDRDWSGGQVCFSGDGPGEHFARISYSGRPKAAADDAPLPAGELSMTADLLRDRWREPAAAAAV